MKQVIVGTFEMGNSRAVLTLREGRGADATFVPKEGGVCCIRIGADQRHWRDIFESLLHEVQEVIIAQMECSFVPANYIGDDSTRYTFLMNHMQFSEMCCRASEFISPAQHVLFKAWKKWKAEGKKTSKKKAVSPSQHPSPGDYPSDSAFKKAVREFHKKSAESARTKKKAKK